VQGQELLRRAVDAEFVEVYVFGSAPAAVLLAALAASVLDQDAAYGLGGLREGGATAFSAWDDVGIDEAEVRLMDQRRGLERLPRLLLGEPPGCAACTSPAPCRDHRPR
jgi:hypothetical protein